MKHAGPRCNVRALHLFPSIYLKRIRNTFPSKYGKLATNIREYTDILTVYEYNQCPPARNQTVVYLENIAQLAKSIYFINFTEN